MAQLHQLLAVGPSVQANYNRDTVETLKVFGSPNLFQRKVTQVTHFDDADTKLNTSVTNEITTTVKDRLAWFSNAAIAFFDHLIQMDSTNQQTKADLKIGDTIIAKDVPAVTLLALENKLQDLRKVFIGMPTLESGLSWEKDETSGYFKTKEPKVTFKTRKTMKAVVLAPSTDKHPAQVEKVFEDVPVAKITEDQWSGMITSKEKADILSRLDTLLQAAKAARQEANSAEMVKTFIGQNIFDYLYKDIVNK